MIESFADGNADQVPTVLIAERDYDSSKSAAALVSRQFPHLPVVRMSYDRNEEFGLISPNYIVLRFSPILPSEFYSAVRQAFYPKGGNLREKPSENSVSENHGDDTTIDNPPGRQRCVQELASVPAR